MKKLSIIGILFALTFCTFLQQKNTPTSPVVNPVVSEVKSEISMPSGLYKLDKTHASLIFRVNHLGFSNYTARFKRFDADLYLDPKNPAKSSVTAVIDATSLETDYPNPEHDFNAALKGDKWLNTAKFSAIKFRSKKVELLNKDSAQITGDLIMHGFQKEVTLYAKFNGGYVGHPMDPSGSRIGFSAKGSLNRSDFGIAFGIPVAGSTMGVSDKVEFILEVEFTKPESVSK